MAVSEQRTSRQIAEGSEHKLLVIAVYRDSALALAAIGFATHVQNTDEIYGHPLSTCGCADLSNCTQLQRDITQKLGWVCGALFKASLQPYEGHMLLLKWLESHLGSGLQCASTIFCTLTLLTPLVQGCSVAQGGQSWAHYFYPKLVWSAKVSEPAFSHSIVPAAQLACNLINP